MRAALLVALLAQAVAPVTFEEPPGVAALTQGRNVTVTCQGPPSARLCIPSAVLMELPQSPRDGQKGPCVDATRGTIWFTRGAEDITEVCERRLDGTIAWRVKR